MIQQLYNILIFVSDVERSLGFYRDVLGLPVRHHNAFAAEFDLEGVRLGLQYMNPAYLGQGVNITLDFTVTHIEEFVARLKQEGVEFTAIVLDQPSGKLAKFRDPDGNLLGIFEAGQ